MQRGIIRRVGDKRVDVQLQGSTSTLSNVPVSAQVSWELLKPGAWVLVDIVNSQPLVLHTLSDTPLFYAPQEQTYTAVLEGALLADGSVPLTGDLPVTPGATVDGYDISVLGQAIDNLQAADGVSRTGFTVLTHASHLVENAGENDTQLLIRHAYFADGEQLLLSNPDGEIEFMRVVGQPEATVDNDGALCYRYTVVRRIATNPAGIRTGWAAATVVNGLTMKGYIAFDARHNRPTTPAMRFVLFTDPVAGETEQIVRMGALANILGYTDADYGFAVGKLTTGNRYIAYSYADDLLSLRGADISVADEGGAEVFRVWATHDGEHAPGDARLGRATGGHIETFGDQVWFFAGSDPVMFLSPAGTRFRNMVWSGTQPGPQIGIGEQDGEAHIVARNAAGLEQFHVRTGDDKVHVHIGNPPPYEHWMQFDEMLTVDGTFRVRDGIILGLLDMGEDGEIRFGTGTPGADFSGLRMGAIGDGDGHYQLAGYEDDQKQAYFGPDGRVYWAGGKGSADASGIRHVHAANAYWEVVPSGFVLSRIVATGLALGVGLQVVAASGRGVQAQATTGWALEGTATEGIGVYGSADEAGGVGVKAVAFSGATALEAQGPSHLEQPSTVGAVPTLTVRQADVDAAFAKVVGESDGATLGNLVEYKHVSAANLAGYLAVEIEDESASIASGKYYLPFYSLTV